MNLTPPELDVLVVAPHPDDAELGMAGAICRFLSEGKSVGIVDLTSGEPTPYGSDEVRSQESISATEILGLTWRGNLGLPNRSLEPTLDARKALATVFRCCRAPWIFAPYWVDAHPDHCAGTKLAEDARFWAKLTKTDMRGEPYHPKRIYNYFSIHLRQAVKPAFILDITPYFETKLQAVMAYESQFIQGRSATSPTFADRLRTNAEYWGQLIGARYGEPFDCKEPIGLASMCHLV